MAIVRSCTFYDDKDFVIINSMHDYTMGKRSWKIYNLYLRLNDKYWYPRNIRFLRQLSYEEAMIFAHYMDREGAE